MPQVVEPEAVQLSMQSATERRAVLERRLGRVLEE
jgi:hypothetical protein